jgi:predicted HAD superfamily phosphohydrolase YqeG
MVFILSNKPTEERKSWFNNRHPGIRFISGVRKKPYPDGLDEVIRIAGVQPHEVTLLDDRLLTGVLATCLAGTEVVYINAPYVDLAGNPFKESFFILLRTVERVLLSL